LRFRKVIKVSNPIHFLADSRTMLWKENTKPLIHI
jgi:hypothetical protein